MQSDALRGPKEAMTDKLIEIADVELIDGWPYSRFQTARLIRNKRLGAVRVGRRVFVTEALLQAFVEAHIRPADTEAA